VEDVFAFEQPEIMVSPTVMAPSIRARWEMDLSPGTRMVPVNLPDFDEVKGRMEKEYRRKGTGQSIDCFCCPFLLTMVMERF
jgi:hypothetical protein